MSDQAPIAVYDTEATIVLLCVPVMLFSAILLSCGECFVHRSRGASFEQAMTRDRNRRPLLRGKKHSPNSSNTRRSWFQVWGKNKSADHDVERGLMSSTFAHYGTFFEDFDATHAAANVSIDFQSDFVAPRAPPPLPPRNPELVQNCEAESASSAATFSPPSPDSFSEDYKLIRTLKGNFCESVHLVRHRLTGQTKIIKQLPCQVDDYGLTVWPTEAEFLSELDHPNIVSLDSVIVDRSGASPIANIVMAHCNGGDLLDFVTGLRDRGSLAPEIFIMNFVHCMIDALAYIHHGEIYDATTGQTHHSDLPSILHRDIKPGNILLDFDESQPRNGLPNVLLADFGLSAVAGSPGLCGTPHFDAPEVLAALVAHEQARDNPTRQQEIDNTCIMTSATDIWTFGASLFYLITGGKLYKAGVTDIEEAFLFSNVADHPEILELLKACLADNPLHRPAANSLGLRCLSTYYKSELQLWASIGETLDLPTGIWPVVDDEQVDSSSGCSCSSLFGLYSGSTHVVSKETAVTGASSSFETIPRGSRDH